MAPAGKTACVLAAVYLCVDRAECVTPYAGIRERAVIVTLYVNSFLPFNLERTVPVLIS